MIRTNSNYRSQEKYAEALNAAHKHVSVLLPREQLEIIQDVLDAHCEELYEDYLSDYSKLEARFIEQARSSMGISSRCLPYGTAPHERAFLDETSEKSRNLRAANIWRQIYKKAKKNPPKSRIIQTFWGTSVNKSQYSGMFSIPFYV